MQMRYLSIKLRLGAPVHMGIFLEEFKNWKVAIVLLCPMGKYFIFKYLFDCKTKQKK
jgi:hypothetical protein